MEESNTANITKPSEVGARVTASVVPITISPRRGFLGIGAALAFSSRNRATTMSYYRAFRGYFSVLIIGIAWLLALVGALPLLFLPYITIVIIIGFIFLLHLLLQSTTLSAVDLTRKTLFGTKSIPFTAIKSIRASMLSIALWSEDGSSITIKFGLYDDKALVSFFEQLFYRLQAVNPATSAAFIGAVAEPYPELQVLVRTQAQ